MLVEVSNGELLDKISILKIKSERIKDPEKLKNVNEELETLLRSGRRLREMFEGAVNIEGFLKDLVKVNEILWDVEDALRQAERENKFDDAFVNNARLVYKTNDKRSEIKKQINTFTGSFITEEKSYEKY